MTEQHFPEERVSSRIAPDTMNEHLRGTWCDIRNSIARDQEGVIRSLESIKSNKGTIRFLNNRIVASLHALDALEAVR